VLGVTNQGATLLGPGKIAMEVGKDLPGRAGWTGDESNPGDRSGIREGRDRTEISSAIQRLIWENS